MKILISTNWKTQLTSYIFLLLNIAMSKPTSVKYFPIIKVLWQHKKWKLIDFLIFSFHIQNKMMSLQYCAVSSYRPLRTPRQDVSKTGCMAMIEHLPYMCEVLSSILNITHTHIHTYSLVQVPKIYITQICDWSHPLYSYDYSVAWITAIQGMELTLQRMIYSRQE